MDRGLRRTERTVFHYQRCGGGRLQGGRLRHLVQRHPGGHRRRPPFGDHYRPRRVHRHCRGQGHPVRHRREDAPGHRYPAGPDHPALQLPGGRPALGEPLRIQCDHHSLRLHHRPDPVPADHSGRRRCQGQVFQRGEVLGDERGGLHQNPGGGHEHQRRRRHRLCDERHHARGGRRHRGVQRGRHARQHHHRRLRRPVSHGGAGGHLRGLQRPGPVHPG